MSCKVRSRFLALLSAFAFLAGCQRAPRRPAVERIAVLRFENLGADVSTDWMGRAFSEVISAELDGAPGIYAIATARLHPSTAGFGGRPAQAPGISTERSAALSAGATEIAYGDYTVRGNSLDVRVTIEDLLTGKMRVLDPVSAASGDLLSAASALARQISPRAGSYGTRNQRVIQAYVSAIEELDQPGVAGNLEKAIAADPNFGPPYRQLAQYRLQQRDAAGAVALLDSALARGDAIPARERALIRLDDASLHNDSAARFQALVALTQADPQNPDGWRDLAVLSVATHRYPQAMAAYQRAVAIEPGNLDYWNQMGYAAAYSGNTALALEAIGHYQALQPASPNAVDSLGDVNLIAGHLGEAEKAYSEGAKKYPDFLGSLDFLKAAMTHLMTGDTAGADALAQQYFDARAKVHDSLLEYRKAEWAWISGRRKEACGQMEQVAGASQPDIASHAYAELAVWNLLLGDREHAAQLAHKAATMATPGSAVPVAIAEFLAQPPASPAEWQARAAKLVPDPAQSAIRNIALVDALLIGKEFDAARPLLQQWYDSGAPAVDEGLPVLLAWADFETGHTDEAAALVRANQPLGEAGLSWSTALYFPRIFDLRAAIAEKQGKSNEARENTRIFQVLSGQGK